MGQSLMFTIFPPIARELGISEVLVGVIFASSGLVWLFTSAYWGRRSDIIGRKPVLLAALAGYAISMMAFATTVIAALQGILAFLVFYPLLVFSRCIFAALSAGGMPSAQAYVADRTNRAERTATVAGISAAFGMGTIIGPGVAAIFVVFGLVAPFYASAALAFAAALLIWLYLPERTPPRERGEAVGPRLHWRDKRIRPFLIIAIGVGMAQVSTLQTIGFYFIDTLHLDATEAPELVGIGMMAAAGAAIFAQLVIIPRANLAARTLMRLGTFSGLAAFTIITLAHSLGQLVFALLLVGLTFGFLRPGLVAAASLSVSRDEQGSVAGLIGSMNGLGPIISPLISMPLYLVLPSAPYLINLAIMTVLGLIVFLHPKVKEAGMQVKEDDEPSAGVPHA
jgi:MFS family permease